QANRVTGRVRDATTHAPVAGARVAIPGATRGTVTDDEGRFQLDVGQAREVIVRVTMLGFVPEQKRVATGGEVAFELVRRALGLDEVVVTGSAGPTRVREVGHSVAQIIPSRISEPVPSIDNMLAGKVPGLSVLQSGGMAASGSQVRLRGNTSVSLSNQPLVYVDGIRIRSEGYPKNVPMVGDQRRSPNDVPSPLNDIDPADVDRVEIVRGPAATTLYGTEAATGVIQIFTKRGAQGKPVWDTQFSAGNERVQRFGTEGEPYMRIDPWLRTANRMGYSLSTSGGANGRYYLSASYNRNEGVLPNDLERRVSMRGNFDFNLSEKLAVAWSTAYTDNDISNTPAGPSSQGITMNAYRGDINYTGVPGKESIDRVLSWDITSHLRHFMGGATATYTASPRSSHVVTVGYDRAADEMRSLRPYGFVFTPAGVLSEERWSATTLTSDYLGRAAFSLSRGVVATLSWGAQSIATDVATIAGYAEDLPGAGVPTISSGARTQAFQFETRAVNAGGFSQVVLDLRNRYFFTAGLRVDGNSAFGRDFGLQPYPRFNATYVISDEDFWPRRFGSVKLRAAYGHAGRAPRVFDAERTWIQGGYDGKPAFLPQAVGNANLGPERTAETEFGFDATIRRLNAAFTWYKRHTSDALFPVTQPASLGFLGSQIQNVGSLQSNGIELSLTGPVFRGRSVSLEAGLDLATHHSKLLSLGGAPRFLIGETGWIEEGSPTPLLRGALVTNPDEIAAPVIDRDHVFGPNVPTHTVGARATLRLPGQIELSARAEYVGGNYVLDRASRHLASNGAWPVCNDAYARVKEGKAQSLTAWERVWCVATAVPENGPIYPADFLRLRALSLSVPLPAHRMRATRATLVVSARNFLLWKHRDFLVFDPEMAGPNGMNSPDRSIDLHVPPAAGMTFAIRASY
ncbi:MAG TPA: TonB-dependent receptor, partial [Gemmatimonadaceae bacterium]|nr:TonB-dependent receptor [Gemmatimonadaceae bacterium]